MSDDYDTVNALSQAYMNSARGTGAIRVLFQQHCLSLWPSEIGAHLRWNRLQVRVLVVSDENHITCS